MKILASTMLFGLILVLAHRASGMTNTIYVYNFDFGILPNTHVDPTIQPGDTVTWVWTNGTHNTTSAPGQLESWDSGTHTPPFAFSHTFSEVGTFTYFCTIHGRSTGCRGVTNMSGHVTVVLSNTVPYRITSITPQSNDVSIQWITGGVCATNILQRSFNTADGSYTDAFTDIFAVTNSTGTITNYLDTGAATNFPASYYRVRVP